MESAYTPMVATLLRGEEEEDLEAEEDDDYADIKKRLFDSLEKPSKLEGVDAPKKQPVVVYLRVRPKSHVEVLNKDPESLHQLGENEVLAVAPKTSQTYRNKSGVRCLSEGNQKFIFTKVFEPSTSQKELFDDALMPTLRDFFDGQNCLVFTYGVTNSGKTYTVTGTATEPGILPRSLDVVFNTVDQRQLRSVGFKPKHFSGLALLTKREQDRELKEKEGILNKARELLLPSSVPPPPPGANETEIDATMSETDISVMSKASTNCSKMTEEGMSLEEIQVHDESAIELDSSNENFQFSIWVSFAEIYNEFIYDLLGEDPKKGKARPALKLADDRNRNQFIKGLREVRVESVEEAMWLLRLGLRHRHVAATRLNYQSSRSHSIYTIKMVKVCASSSVDKPKNALVNRLSIVDLAGAERSGKTGATGVRVREAGNINNSLLTLGKCIHAMRFNQTRKSSDERVVPFRESKLTRLFQNYFVGKGNGVRQGKINMFVNVSNVASVFDETIHVLKFSALASKVIPIVKEAHGRHHATPCPSLPAPPLLHPYEPSRGEGARKSIMWETEEEGEDEGSEEKQAVATIDGSCPRCKVLECEVSACLEAARAKVCELEVKLLEQECTLRQEVCREFNEQLIEIEERHSNELEEQAEDLQGMYDQRVQLLHRSMKKQFTRKRRRPNDEDSDAGEDVGEEQRLRVEVANLRDRLRESKQELELERNKASAELQDASQTYETKTVMLNKQLMDMALKLSAMEKKEKELAAQSQPLAACEDAESVASEQSQTHVGWLKERKELESRCETLQDQLTLALEDVASLKSRNEDLDMLQGQECEQLRAQLGTAESQLAELSTQVSALQEEKDSLVEKHRCIEADLQSQCDSFKSEVDLSMRRVAELAGQNADLEEEKETVFQKYEEAQQTLASYTTQTVVTVEERDSQLSAMEAKQQGLLDELDALRAHVAELEPRNKSLEDDKASFKETEECLKAENADVLAEVEILQSMISELTKERGAVEEDRQLLEVRVEALQQQVSSENVAQEMKDSELSGVREELEGRNQEMSLLRARAEYLQNTNGTLNDELCGMRRTLQETLKEYETTLKKQSSRIQELEGENEMLHSHNEELRESITGMEVKLEKVSTVREGLSSRVEELSQALEASRRALSQRESELLDSSDQCKAVLEEQIAHQRKHSATLEHELCASREDLKSLQQQLSEKECELLSVARETSGEKAAVQSLTSQMEEARQREKDLQDRILAMEGHHQLETSQLSIKLRELTGALEAMEEEAEGSRKELAASLRQEVETVRREWSEEVEELNRQLKQMEKKAEKLKTLEQEHKTLKRSNSSLKKEAEGQRKEKNRLQEELQAQISTLESDLKLKDQDLAQQRASSERELLAARREVEMAQRRTGSEEEGDTSDGGNLPEEPIYDMPPELPDDSTIYETIPGDVSSEAVVTTDQEGAGPGTPSVLQSIENTMRPLDEVPVDLDLSRPFIPNLERSSQLIEDSFSKCHEVRIEIDATPKAAKRRGGRTKKAGERGWKTEPKRKKGKRGIEMRDPDTGTDESEEVLSPPAVKISKYALRNRSKHQRFLQDEESENLAKTSSLKKVTMQYLSSASRSATSFLREKVERPPPSSPVGSNDMENPITTTATGKATRTRCRIRKSQISAPLELLNSPAPSRTTRVLLGRQLRPARR